MLFLWMGIFTLAIGVASHMIEAQQFIPPDTVNSLNLTSYYGRWYQMYASKLPNTTIEKNGYCVTADHYPVSNRSNVAFGLTNSLR